MKLTIIVLTISVLLVSMVSGAVQPSIEKVREKHEPGLFAIEGVSAVSVDEAKNEIVVYIDKPEISSKVPKVLDGFKVRYKVTGRIKAIQSTTEILPIIYPEAVYSRTGVIRPNVFGGISLGNVKMPCCAGTLGFVTRNNYILSNAHVLAMDSNANFVKIGTQVWQPGGTDGGTSDHAIGALYKYMPIKFYDTSAKNYADAAIATLTVGKYQGSVLNKNNNGFYTISGTTGVSSGNTVRKSGRTTGVTTNTVSSTTASVKVYYTNSKWAIFSDQIIVNQPFIKPGDSGSAVDKGGSFVGLVFAASDTIAVVNKAKYIISGLGIKV